MTDIFQEVDEELRQDRALALWKRYGNYVVAAAVLLVLLTAGYVAWKDYRQREREASGERYAAAMALLAEGKTAEAATAFGALSQGASGEYGALARLEEAAARARLGEMDAALKVYDSLAADRDARADFRELAVLLSVLHRLDTIDPAAGIEKLQPLAASEGPWRFSARELTAVLALRTGDAAKAKETYRALADDLKAPAALRARAAEMLAVLGA
ncbi:MAG: tetratricopeptide repeat protein [Alphaproteobacteria bacterium]